MVKWWVACKIKFTSHKALLDKLNYVLRQLYCYVLSQEENRKAKFPKVYFKRVTKIGVISQIGLKQTIRKIRELQASQGNQKKC